MLVVKSANDVPAVQWLSKFLGRGAPSVITILAKKTTCPIVPRIRAHFVQHASLEGISEPIFSETGGAQTTKKVVLEKSLVEILS